MSLRPTPDAYESLNQAFRGCMGIQTASLDGKTGLTFRRRRTNPTDGRAQPPTKGGPGWARFGPCDGSTGLSRLSSSKSGCNSNRDTNLASIRKNGGNRTFEKAVYANPNDCDH